MSSTFNPQVRERFCDFDGKIKEQMPLLLADNRYPMFTTELFEQRLQGKGIDRHVDTGDLIVYGPKKTNMGEQEIKIILTSNRKGLTELGRTALGLINPHSGYTNGALNLSNALDANGRKISEGYDILQGEGVIAVKRKDLGTLDTLLTKEQVLNHKGWRILMRHPEEVPPQFAEDFEKAKEYLNHTVFSKYNCAMGMYLANGETVPTLRALCVIGLDVSGWSVADCGCDLGIGVGCLVGVAPEAPIACDANSK